MLVSIDIYQRVHTTTNISMVIHVRTVFGRLEHCAIKGVKLQYGVKGLVGILSYRSKILFKQLKIALSL